MYILPLLIIIADSPERHDTRYDIVVGELHSLGQACRAAGEEQEGGVRLGFHVTVYQEGILCVTTSPQKVPFNGLVLPRLTKDVRVLEIRSEHILPCFMLCKWTAM